MTSRDRNRCLALFARLSAPFWTGSVASWCEESLYFNEPKLSGPFNFSGREYMREPLDSWSDDGVSDLVMTWGTRTGKTRIIFGGLAWRIRHNPTRCLWVMPNAAGTGGAQNVSRTRFQPMLRSSSTLAELIPAGARRHDFKTSQMMIGGSIIDLTGSNSPANLAGNPCDTVVQDECDKFKRRGESEADPCQLADQRCKEFSTPKRVKTSTPTLVSGKIWQELLKSDMRRRFMPCPHCSKPVVFIWSKKFTLLPLNGSEAPVRWDDEARREDGRWDLDRVVRSARAECPHCGGHIRDEHKIETDKAGIWQPTQQGAPGYRGYHLSSMYSVSVETSFGAMAKRFLLAKRSLNGLQDFINSDLAEPYANQDLSRERIELVTPSRIERGSEWKGLLSADYQQKSPRLWFVVRFWDGGNSEGAEAGHCEQFEDIAARQKAWRIQNEGVVIDSGFGSKLQTDSGVYRECAARCDLLPRNDKLPVLLGWMPAKGFSGYKRWRSDEGPSPIHKVETDPFMGTSQAGQALIELFEFSSDYFKDRLEKLRAGAGGFKWSVSLDMKLSGNGMDMSVYWKHMDSNIKKEVVDRRTQLTNVIWAKRSSHFPDHLYDCEVMQTAMASDLGFFNVEEQKVENKQREEPCSITNH